MIVVSNTAEVTLTPGQALTFNNLIWKSGCAESFRNIGSAIRAGNGVYEVSFNGNVSGAAAGTSVQLNIEVDGAPLPETTMISTPGTAALFNNVAASTIVGNQPNCCNNPGSISLTVVNTGTVNIVIAPNSKFSVKRVG